MRLARSVMVLCVALAGPVWAGPVSLFDADRFGPQRGSIATGGVGERGEVRMASLFVGRSDAGLFAPASKQNPPSRGGLPGLAPEVAALLGLIAQAEAGPAGYDAVQHGAVRRPDRPPTQMTVSEVFDWIEATPRQPHAIGRYQFIPATLRRLVAGLGIDGAERFSPALQDRLALALLNEAGLHRFSDGRLERRAFMRNLARIWAGLPTAEGVSHYHGVAGNKATIGRASFEAEMVRIFGGPV